MSYQTPEMLAKQVIERLSASQLDGRAVWIHTAPLAPENKHPRKMNMIAHLLIPLTKSTQCRPFFLTNNDILLVGTEALVSLCLPIIEQIKQVLSDDPFIAQNAHSFFTVFEIKTQKELLLSALTALITKQKTDPLKTTDLYPIVQETFKKNNLIDFIHLRAVIHLTPQTKKQSMTLCTLDVNALLHRSFSDISMIPHWIKSAARTKTLSENLEHFAYYNNLKQQILLPVLPGDINTVAFDFFMQHRTTPTLLLFSISDFFLQEETTTAALKKCHTMRYKWGLILTNTTQLPLFDFTKISPDVVCVPGKDLTPDMLPAGLKKETIILTDIQSETPLFSALRHGFTLFEGSLIASLVGNACQKRCPYGDTCSAELCAQITSKIKPLSACVFPKFHQEYLFEEQEEF